MLRLLAHERHRIAYCGHAQGLAPDCRSLGRKPDSCPGCVASPRFVWPGPAFINGQLQPEKISAQTCRAHCAACGHRLVIRELGNFLLGSSMCFTRSSPLAANHFHQSTSLVPYAGLRMVEFIGGANRLVCLGALILARVYSSLSRWVQSIDADQSLSVLQQDGVLRFSPRRKKPPAATSSSRIGPYC